VYELNEKSVCIPIHPVAYLSKNLTEYFYTMEIFVCTYQHVQYLVEQTNAKYVLSVGNSPEMDEGILDQLKFLYLQFADIDNPVPQNIRHAASKEQIQQIIDFAKHWNGNGPMIINCRQGHRRSPAAAYIVMAALSKHKDYSALLNILRMSAPHAEPNKWMIKVADYLLQCEGKMNEALAVPFVAEKVRPDYISLQFD